MFQEVSWRPRVRVPMTGRFACNVCRGDWITSLLRLYAIFHTRELSYTSLYILLLLTLLLFLFLLLVPLVLLLIILLFGLLGPMASSDSELFWINDSYRQSVGFLGRGIGPSQGRYLHRTTQTLKKSGRTSMHGVGLEPTIPVFEIAKRFHALESADIVMGFSVCYVCFLCSFEYSCIYIYTYKYICPFILWLFFFCKI
jgi:hypothetical protein